MIKKLSKRDMRPFFRDHPKLARPLVLLSFPTAIILLCGGAVWDSRYKIWDAMEDLVAYTFAEHRE